MGLEYIILVKISILVRRITVKILLFYTLYYIYSSNLNDSCNLLAYCISFIYIYSGDSNDDSENAAATDSDDSSEDNEDAAAIRANYPVPSQCKLFYFEIEIIDKGKNGYVGYIFLFPS